LAFGETASFGKRQEFVAIAELLRRGLDVYLSLVEYKQIDCVKRREVDGKPIYLDIQIKARFAGLHRFLKRALVELHIVGANHAAANAA